MLEPEVKRHMPLDSMDASEGNVTVIGTHAKGFPKVRVRFAEWYV